MKFLFSYLKEIFFCTYVYTALQLITTNVHHPYIYKRRNMIKHINSLFTLYFWPGNHI